MSRFRWNSYSNNWGWFANNENQWFGGVHPSQWGDDSGNGFAWQISADKNIQRTLFNKLMWGGWNLQAIAEEWFVYSSTNSQTFGVLFRIRNKTPNAINWRTAFWYSAYSGWGEETTAAINGQNQWQGNGACAYCSSSTTFTVPANRMSTVIFTAGSSDRASGCCDFGPRTNMLIFTENSMKLPAGLEYENDLDYATGGYEA